MSRAKLHEIFKESGISEENVENVAGQVATLGAITRLRDSPELQVVGGIGAGIWWKRKGAGLGRARR